MQYSRSYKINGLSPSTQSNRPFLAKAPRGVGNTPRIAAILLMIAAPRLVELTSA
jgi:hypothetical protein